MFDMATNIDPTLSNDVHGPDMTDIGLSFQGARQMVVDGGKPAHQFHYTADQGGAGPVTVTMWRSNEADLAPIFDRRDDINVVYWRRDGHGYAIVGDVDKEQMLLMSRDIAWQLHHS